MDLIKNTEKTFKKVFNSGQSRNKRIINAIDSIIKLKTDTNVGKPIKFDKRTIYPVIQTSVTKKREFIAAEIFPIALVIEEPQGEYVISLNEEEIRSKELIRKIQRNSKKSFMET